MLLKLQITCLQHLFNDSYMYVYTYSESLLKLLFVSFSEQKAAEKQSKLAKIMEKQASTVSAVKHAQENSDGHVRKMLVAQYGHESDEEL